MPKLQITLLGGRNLSAKDSNGKSDPYVKLKWMNQKFKSSVRKATLNPDWNETFVFNVGPSCNPPIRLEIMDKDLISDDEMGYCNVDFNRVQMGVPNEMWIPVQNGRGTIGVRLLAIDFGNNNNNNGVPNNQINGIKPTNEWSCPACTYLNNASNSTCEMCSTPNPNVNRSNPPPLPQNGHVPHNGYPAPQQAAPYYPQAVPPPIHNTPMPHYPTPAQGQWGQFQGMPYVAPPLGMYPAPCVNQPPPPAGRKRALLIGINYYNTPGQLRGCINDVKNMKNVLLNYGFKDDRNSMVVLTDDQRDPNFVPTKHNIITAMQWLVAGVQPGDILFFHYSGHGAQQYDPSGAEEDGMDETILPVDFKRAGQITDDVIFNTMVKPLPSGAKLTAIMDCCHSGTGLDLPFTWSNYGWREDTNPHHSLGDVQLFSGCEDSQTSADMSGTFNAGGAMTTAFIAVLQRNPCPTYPELMNELHRHLRSRGFTQRPQLTSSQKFDYNKVFILTDIVPNMNPYVGRLLRKRKKKRRNFSGGLGTMLAAGAIGFMAGSILTDVFDPSFSGGGLGNLIDGVLGGGGGLFDF